MSLFSLLESVLGIGRTPDGGCKILWMRVVKIKECSTCFKKYILGFKFAKIEKFPQVRLERDVNIERNVSIGRFSYLCSGTKVFRNVKIGNFCSIANNVIVGASAHPLNCLSTHPFQYEIGFFTKNNDCLFDNFPSTVIGHDVWIGSNVVIKCGVHIGNGAVIGCGAVVTKDVPPYAVVTGVPAQIKKYRCSEECIKALEKLEWWNFAEEDLKGLSFDNIEDCIRILTERKAKYEH